MDSWTLFLLWLVFPRSAVHIVTLRLRTKANRCNTQDKNIYSSKHDKEHENFYLNDLNQLFNPTFSRKHWLQSKTQSHVSITLRTCHLFNTSACWDQVIVALEKHWTTGIKFIICYFLRYLSTKRQNKRTFSDKQVSIKIQYIITSK